MNPVASGLLLAFALVVVWAPWRRDGWRSPGGALVVEVCVAALVVAGAVVLDARMVAGEWRDWGEAVLYLAAYVYGVGGGVGVVRMVLRLVPVEEAAPPGGIAVSRKELARGRMIGVLERAIVLTLVLVGEFGALGLIVAAKAIARFRGLEDRDFAEYFLIGTLASLLHAMAVAVGVGLLPPG